ncbi:hypothetical protein TNCV_1130791 [Trichonephila clavipes]|nr:hypothetical protein TNCV_1130791 [Trichonephila clavipes]
MVAGSLSTEPEQPDERGNIQEKIRSTTSQKLIVTLDIILNLPDYDDEDDFDRVKDSLTSRFSFKDKVRKHPQHLKKPDVSSDNLA